MKILSQKIEMLIPWDFKLMSAHVLEEKFPKIGSRPEEVYTNKNSSVTLAFTRSVKKADAIDIQKHIAELAVILKKKGINIDSQKQTKINGNIFFVIDFNSKVNNGTIHNKMFFFSSDERLVIGNYSYMSSISAQYVGMGDEMLKSIKLL